MAAATFTSAIAAAAVPLENNNNNIISSSPFFPRKQNKEEEGIPPHSSSSSRLSKPSWVVRTESNVWKERRKRPDPPCDTCKGTARVDCRHCLGRGRTNCVHLPMLPKGEWPKWICGGSGLDYCSRCLGTGEYRDIMGFRFMKLDSNPYKKHQ
ncbi:uncharacterized protein LOC18437402 isoform X2 [Amborella trichopoda]|uniref:uncharacterized protein LOC18437402 isoform X2 n=1 Tax=Amborella trichopoda TaxID=13333 RepID=UPI0009C114BF|nr:uncharacterized protein LOC18437402 isoform X2 [Amborella trichopoda]|eukprot:XP_020524868.1 uncharacterized protein LOC18437402 isoform X2 [Amborella trichopoda]